MLKNQSILAQQLEATGEAVAQLSSSPWSVVQRTTTTCSCKIPETQNLLCIAILIDRVLNIRVSMSPTPCAPMFLNATLQKVPVDIILLSPNFCFQIFVVVTLESGRHKHEGYFHFYNVI